MEPTQCPVCNTTLTGSVESVTQHVNLCIDDNESVNYIKKLVGYGGWAFPVLHPDQGENQKKPCPICGKDGGGEAKHIKKCGTENGVETKKLISLYKDNRRKKSSKASEDPSNTDVSNGPVLKKKRQRTRKEIVANNYIIASTSDCKLSLSKAPPKLQTELTKLTQEEKESRIKDRIDHVLSTNIVADNCTYGTPPQLPYCWQISSLIDDEVRYIVEGFERFCSKLDLSNELDRRATTSTTDVNEPQETA